jgi:hypothetical protein
MFGINRRQKVGAKGVIIVNRGPKEIASLFSLSILS